MRKIFLLNILILSISFAFANQTDSIWTGLQLDEIEVSAARLEKDIIIPQRLEGKQLQSLNTLSVADAIRYFSGAQLKDYGGVAGLKTVNIRSMGTNHIGIYYNGIQIGNAQNGQVDLGKFSLENIEQIDLYHGQRSDIFQSAREFGSAGSVYLTSRRPRFKEGEHFHIKAQMRAGSFRLINPSVLVDVRLTEKISMSMNAELTSSDGKYKFRYKRVTPSGQTAYDTTAVRQNGDINAIRAEASLNDYYSNTGFVRLQLYHYNSERGVPGAIVNNVWRNGERLWDRNSFVQAQWEDEFFNRWNIRVNAKYANDFTHYINYDNRLLYVDNRYLQQEFYLSFANCVKLFRFWDLSVAYDLQWNGLSKYMNANRLSHWLSLATAFNVKNYLRLQASVLGTFVKDFGKTQNGKTSNPQAYRFTPAVFLSYRPTQKADLKFNAFYKQSYRFPTFNDLYYTDMGNADLRPELAKQRSVGLSYTLPFCVETRKNVKRSMFSIQADYYYNRIKDKIIAYPKGQQFRWTMLNLGDVKINGLDVNTQLVFAFDHDVTLTTKLQYTYQTAIDVTDPNDVFYGDQIPYIPWHSGSAIVMLSWREYTLNYSFMYVGERYNEQENSRYNYMQPWYTHDLSVSGEWELKRKDRYAEREKTATLKEQGARSKNRYPKLKASVDIGNLLGQDYEVILNYPMPKQNVKCTVTLTY